LRVLRTSSSRWRVMSSSSSHSYSYSSCSYSCSSSSSTSHARWLTWRACTARSSPSLMTAMARATVDAYNSCASARARLESMSHWAMASTCRSKPCCRARASTLFETVVLLSMLAHSWRRWHSSARSPPSRRRTRCTWDRARCGPGDDHAVGIIAPRRHPMWALLPSVLSSPPSSRRWARRPLPAPQGRLKIGPLSAPSSMRLVGPHLG
jgi:hypothetical protein